MRIVWLRGESTSDLIFVCHHCVFDGTSLVTACRELLILLDRPDADIGAPEWFAGLDELLPPDVLASRRNRWEGKVIALLLRIYATMAPARTVTPAGEQYWLRWDFDPQSTATLAARCRRARVTPYAAICGGFLRAFCEVRGDDRFHNRAVCPVDLRLGKAFGWRHVPRMREDMLFGFSVDTAVSLDVELEFTAGVRKLHDGLCEKLRRLDPCKQLMISENFHPMLQEIVTKVGHPGGERDVIVSSWGRPHLPARYHSFEVTGVECPMVGSLEAPCAVTLTFGDRMKFLLIGDEAALPRHEAAEIRRVATQLLLGESFS
jgi:hypothetical protein